MNKQVILPTLLSFILATLLILPTLIELIIFYLYGPNVWMTVGCSVILTIASICACLDLARFDEEDDAVYKHLDPKRREEKLQNFFWPSFGHVRTIYSAPYMCYFCLGWVSVNSVNAVFTGSWLGYIAGSLPYLVTIPSYKAGYAFSRKIRELK